jgi:L-aminopeptidase/D-esterase-like protein
VIWELDGLSVGHVTHVGARTGCTVVLASPAAQASGEVRGSAPANREFSLLDPMATVQRVDAVVLSGGSAFGLAAADGVVSWLAEHDRGFPTRWGRVPIVVGMSLFDLPTGDPDVRPSAADGYAAAEAAADGTGSHELGAVGAGAGATVGKWRGAELAVDAGLVGAVLREGPLVVGCLVAVNAWGDVVGAGRWAEPEPVIASGDGSGPGGSDAFANTTVGVVATNAALDKVGLQHVARGAHDGLARAVNPPHASVDGDAFVSLSTGRLDAPLDLVRWMAVKVVQQAITTLPGTD